VLTEYYMDEKHGSDLLDARLRALAQEGAEMLAAARDVRTPTGPTLLDAALDRVRESACRRALALLESFGYSKDLLARAREGMNAEDADWRARAFPILAPALSQGHAEALFALFAPADRADVPPRNDEERRVELALGRYAWAT